MGAYAQNYLKMLHRQSIGNKVRLADAKDCGCYFCFSHFAVAEVEYWDDEDDQTAVCPHCGIDSVIGEYEEQRVPDDLLKAMKERYFGCDVDSEVEHSDVEATKPQSAPNCSIDSVIDEYQLQRILDDLLKELNEQ